MHKIKKKTGGAVTPSFGVVRYIHDPERGYFQEEVFPADKLAAMTAEDVSEACRTPTSTSAVIMGSVPFVLQTSGGPCPMAAFYLPKPRVGFVLRDEHYGTNDEYSFAFIEDAIALILNKAQEFGETPENIRTAIAGGACKKAQPTVRRLEDIILENKMQLEQEATGVLRRGREDLEIRLGKNRVVSQGGYVLTVDTKKGSIIIKPFSWEGKTDKHKRI